MNKIILVIKTLNMNNFDEFNNFDELEESKTFHINQMLAMNGYSQYNKEYKITKNKKIQLNSLFNKSFKENNVSLILKKIYDDWLIYENNLKKPLTNVVGKKIKDILKKDDGGGNVQFNFY